MTIIKSIERLELLHSLINHKKTGAPEQLAKRLGVSRSYLYLMIDDLKTLNLQVSYSRKKNTFYYKNEVELVFSLKTKTLSHDDLININAGSLTYFLPSSILNGANLSLYSY